MNISWKKFIETKRANPEPQPLLVEALSFVQNKDTVLDIGAGPLIDAEYLLKKGFREVVSVDPDSTSAEVAENIADKGFVFHNTHIEAYSFPAAYFDMVSAQFVLPYMKEAVVQKVLKRIHDSLKPGGVFTGHLFGENDSWNTPEDFRMYTSLKKTREMLQAFDFVVLREEEKDTVSRLGKPKHSHKIEFIVTKS